MSLKIIRHRYLNEASFKFSLVQYRIFLLSIARLIKFNKFGEVFYDDKLFTQIHTISAKNLSEEFKLNLSGCYRELKKAGSVFIEKNIHVKSIETGELQYIALCSLASYNDGVLSLKFSQNIVPYLQNLTKNYATMNLKKVSTFKSLYSIRLYEVVVAGYKGLGRCKKSIEELRFILGVDTDKLKEYSHFKKTVVTNMINEINKIQTKLNLEFTEIKASRKVAEIEFRFKKSTKVVPGKITSGKVDKKVGQNDNRIIDVRTKLLNLGISKKVLQMYYGYSNEQLNNGYEAIQKRLAKTKIENIDAYFVTIMKNMYNK